MILTLVHLVVLGDSGHGVLVARPAAAGNADHGIPRHGHAQDGVDTLGAVENHTEAAVDGAADARTTAVVQGDVAHAAGSVTSVALGRHLGHDVGAVLDVGGLTEGRIGTAGVVMVTAKDDGADLTVADHLVELEREVHTAHGILIEDTALGADDQLVLLGVADPDIVVVVLIAAVVGLDVLGGSHVGLVQILGVAAQAAPTERAVAEVEQAGTKDIFDVGGEDEAVEVILAVLADALHTGVVNSLEEAVAVVEEVGAALVELADHLIVMMQRLVDEDTEAVGILVEHFGALLEREALRAVAAVIRHVAGGLVAHQVDMDVVVVQVLEQVDNVAAIGDSAGLAFLLVVESDLGGLFERVGAVADPALGVTGLDTGIVDLGDDGGSAGDLSSLALSAAHAAKTGGDEQTAGEVLIVGDAELQTAGVEQRVERAVDDALGADVHPAAGGHLTVVGNAERSSAVEVLLVIEGTDHQAVGDDDARSHLVGVEQTQRMTGHDDEGLLIGQLLEVLLDQTVLHPVLADLAGLTVGDELIGIESDIEVEVVVDHDLNGLALDALALVFVDGLAVELALGTEAVAIDTAVLFELLRKLLGHLLMMVGVDVTQGVLDGERLIGLGQVGFAAGCATVALFELRILGKLVVQLDRHRIVCKIDHGGFLTFIKIFL